MNEDQPTQEEIDEYFAAENDESLKQVPVEQLPTDLRQFLSRCALAGRDVYAYQRPIGDEYNVWYNNRRYEARELTELWRAGKLLVEASDE